VLLNLISSLVILYSFKYLEADKNLKPFIANMCLFIFNMELFILSSNLIMLYIGWEGVGLCSYLLINHWHNRRQANKAKHKSYVNLIKLEIAFLLLAAIFC
jgi:NADH:ubiquinone oxidoreductase subunit 5 (subunit L)/multisubunit Na+/H+ antiporter MnhA subunit